MDWYILEEYTMEDYVNRDMTLLWCVYVVNNIDRTLVKSVGVGC